MVVLVTGASGQLGQALQLAARCYPSIQFIFCTSADLDITNKDHCKTAFSKYQPDYCINAAAYTAVDKAEEEPEKAFDVNVTGVKNVAEACKLCNTTLFHISTDFVFDGRKQDPYTEDDEPNPQSVYGKTKLEGEKALQCVLDNYFIIRTSWVYSDFGNNFKKTMLRLAKQQKEISVVNDQTGCPTNAVDLANVLLQMIIKAESLKSNPEKIKKLYGIYNYSGHEICTWYDFARSVFKENNIDIIVIPISAEEYPTLAKRPKYSVLDKNKIENTFGAGNKNQANAYC